MQCEYTQNITKRQGKIAHLQQNLMPILLLPLDKSQFNQSFLNN